jgi:hypothetical protein
MGTEIMYPKTLRTGFFRRRSIMLTSAARPCRSSCCHPPPSCVAPSFTPMETRISHGWSIASEGLALALLPGCPPQALTPASHRCSVRTPFRQEIFRTPPRPLVGRVCVSIQSRKTCRTGQAGDVFVGARILCFPKALRTWLPDSC